MDANSEIWNNILYNLKLQMTQATFDTWLKTSELISQEGDHLAVAVRSQYAVDWLSTRLHDTVLRTAERVIGRPVQVTFVVADDGNHHPQTDDRDVDAAEEDVSELDRDLPPDCRFLVELVNFDLTTTGFVMTSNYAWQYWQPYLAMIEKEYGARTRVTFNLWNTLRSFPAAWTTRQQPEWPSVEMLTSMLVCDREKITGRAAHSGHNEVVGALEILETEHIVWVVTRGLGRDRIYTFRVRDNLPLLTPVQISKLDSRLQERHGRELARCKLDYGEWEQLTLSSLLED